MSEVVRVEVSDRIATVTLNRPDKLNAVSPEVFEGLYEAGQRVAADDEVRAVLLRGEGRSFCSGLDLASLQAFGQGAGNGGSSSQGPPNGGSSSQGPPNGGSSSQGPPNGGSGSGSFDGRRAQGGFSIWATMSKPVVAAVQGHALGAGFQLALAADLRVAAAGAQMSVFEITYGLVPDLGGTQLLPQIVGPARAKELIWTARRITTDEALDWGIVNRVVEPDKLAEEAHALAADLASRPPLPIAFTKDLVGRSGRVPLEDGMRGEIEAQMKCITSNDMREAVAAAFEKRPGAYTGT